jgi:hypothetical protein
MGRTATPFHIVGGLAETPAPESPALREVQLVLVADCALGEGTRRAGTIAATAMAEGDLIHWDTAEPVAPITQRELLSLELNQHLFEVTNLNKEAANNG